MQGGRVRPPPVLLLHPWDPQLFPLGLSGSPAPVTAMWPALTAGPAAWRSAPRCRAVAHVWADEPLMLTWCFPDNVLQQDPAYGYHPPSPKKCHPTQPD